MCPSSPHSLSFGTVDRTAISASETKGAAVVQRSALVTLANLLAPREASRKLSMPAFDLSSLRNLVSNLRDGESGSGDDGTLLAEMAECVDTTSLPGLDGTLAAGATAEVRDGALHIGGARLPLPAAVGDAHIMPPAQTSASTLGDKMPDYEEKDDDGRLLGAAALVTLWPHALACADCSLSLSCPPADTAYGNLPSEH